MTAVLAAAVAVVGVAAMYAVTAFNLREMPRLLYFGAAHLFIIAVLFLGGAASRVSSLGLSQVMNQLMLASIFVTATIIFVVMFSYVQNTVLESADSEGDWESLT